MFEEQLAHSGERAARIVTHSRYELPYKSISGHCVQTLAPSRERCDVSKAILVGSPPT
jgi:hypothetical protein